MSLVPMPVADPQWPYKADSMTRITLCIAFVLCLYGPFFYYFGWIPGAFPLGPVERDAVKSAGLWSLGFTLAWSALFFAGLLDWARYNAESRAKVAMDAWATTKLAEYEKMRDDSVQSLRDTYARERTEMREQMLQSLKAEVQGNVSAIVARLDRTKAVRYNPPASSHLELYVIQDPKQID